MYLKGFSAILQAKRLMYFVKKRITPCVQGDVVSLPMTLFHTTQLLIYFWKRHRWDEIIGYVDV